MNTLDHFPLPDEASSPALPLAILSGELIHIIHPNGKVEMTTRENIQQKLTQNKLENFIVWGRFEEF
ncbi:MAG TPA: hypothetical protein DCQ63_02605 [Planktothrix sp. UBA8402]|nr:hypothetical protein [Planktothrix sp. UBA8402]